MKMQIRFVSPRGVVESSLLIEIGARVHDQITPGRTTTSDITR